MNEAAGPARVQWKSHWTLVLSAMAGMSFYTVLTLTAGRHAPLLMPAIPVALACTFLFVGPALYPKFTHIQPPSGRKPAPA